MPQEGGFDFWHALSGLGGGAFGTFLTWFWRAARTEPKIRLDMKAEINAAERRFKEDLEELVKQFRESFQGLRQKISDVELEAERTFVSKADFDEWRREYREDMRELKQNIAAIANRH